MSTLTFQMDEPKAERLADAARARGVEVEELLRQLAEDFLAQKAHLATFDGAAEYVLKKNAELHRRLAQ